jgi:putative hydrolase of the HAD superfamily
VPRLEACLVDAYDTIVTCDFSPLRRGVPTLAGIPVETWEGEYGQIGPLLNDGRMSKAEAFGHMLAACGVQATDGLVAEMVRRDQELLLANARLFDDVVPFLQRLRDRGIKIAIVSNCTENTRPLLVATGVDALADTLVLSCEVGAAKPAPEIFRCALDRLGVTADAAVFIDDQPGYCAGSVAAGIRAVQIVRANLDGQGLNGQGLNGQIPAPEIVVVRSLPEVESLFGE